MKKIVTIIIAIFYVLCNKAYADTLDSTLVKHRYNDVYAVYDASDRVHLYYAQRYTLNDITAYCIEPGLGIDTDLYSSTDDWSITNLNSETKNAVRLIAYYGYDYPGHNTMEYYLATQELIWRKIEGREVYWVRGESVDSPKIDISHEKEEIRSLVEKHTLAPSFDNQVITLTLGKKTTINDDNNVLHDYDIYSSDIPNTTITDDKLIITAESIASDAEIRLIKKHYTNSVALIYHSGNNQKLVRAGILDPVISSAKVKINIKAKVKVYKINKDLQNTIKKAGFKFKIKNTDTNEYLCEYDDCLYQTNDKGYFITDLLEVGKYQLEEVEDQDFYDYTWNSNYIQFTIDENADYKYENDVAILEIKYPNRQVKGEIRFTKTGETANIKYGKITYEYEPLSNVKFKLYVAEDIYDGFGRFVIPAGEMITYLTTLQDGTYYINRLYLGKYCLEELFAPSNYQLLEEPYCFSLEYKDRYTEVVSVNVNLKNNLKKGAISLFKKDALSGKPISNTKIGIYTILGELAYEGMTDSEGKIYLSDLPIGKYYYKEIVASQGYLLDTTKHYFEITENEQIVYEELTNNPITGTFEFLKMDYETNEPLANTKIGIYNEKNELLYEKVTNEEGKIAIENIQYGKYYFVELIAPAGYTLDTQRHYFEIADANVIVKANMTNERIPVPNTYLNEKDIVYFISIGLIAISIFLIRNKKVLIKALGIFLTTVAVILPIYQKEKNVVEEKTIKAATINYINNTSKRKEEASPTETIKQVYNYVAVLEIPSISLKQGLVNKYSKYNDVKYNIQIIDGSSFPNIIGTNLILAAHSGNSKASYFKNLYKLKDNEEVYIYYNSNKYIYKINTHYEVEKTGYIDIERDNTTNAITLITCKDDNYQIVYLGYLINIETY